MILVRVRQYHSQQAGIRATHAVHGRQQIGRGLFRIEGQAKIEDQPRTILLQFDAGTAYLFSAAVDANVGHCI